MRIHYLYPGRQTIGFPLLTLSDIRCSSVVCARRCAQYVWFSNFETLVHLKLVMHVFILLANTDKGQECHFVAVC